MGSHFFEEGTYVEVKATPAEGWLSVLSVPFIHQIHDTSYGNEWIATAAVMVIAYQNRLGRDDGYEYDVLMACTEKRIRRVCHWLFRV